MFGTKTLVSKAPALLATPMPRDRKLIGSMHGRSFSLLASHLPVSGSRHDRDRSGVPHGPFGLRFGRMLRGRREAAVKWPRPPNVLARERGALAVLKRRARGGRADV